LVQEYVGQAASCSPRFAFSCEDSNTKPRSTMPLREVRSLTNLGEWQRPEVKVVRSVGNLLEEGETQQRALACQRDRLGSSSAPTLTDLAFFSQPLLAQSQTVAQDDTPKVIKLAERPISIRRIVLLILFIDLVVGGVFFMVLLEFVSTTLAAWVSSAFAVGGYVIALAAAMSHDYYRIIKFQSLDLDKYVGTTAGFWERAWVAFATRMGGADIPSFEDAVIPLEAKQSPFIPGLAVVQRCKNPAARLNPLNVDSSRSIVFSTLRMGFGHYRLAYAACSWAQGTDKSIYFHDLLNIESDERQLLLDNDNAYRACSKLVSEVGGPIEKVWGILTTSQKNCRMQLRNFINFAYVMRPLIADIPRDTPVICTHCVAGNTAIACGFKKVINLVVDNHAKWDVVVPGAINLVQGPKMYMDLLNIGVPQDHLRYAGHWIPRDIVENLSSDCRIRVQRAHAGEPMRLLVPIGGAGAQKRFVSQFVRALRKDLLEGRCELVLNAGDHSDIQKAFTSVLAEMPDVSVSLVQSAEGLQKLLHRFHSGLPAEAQVTLLAFDEYFSAVCATDNLIRCSDVLICKPSELAFYPIPKLHIRRVGDHEEASAVRAVEIGDGTLEAREPIEAIRVVHSLQLPALREHMNDCIVRNAKSGLYDGCKVAVELAKTL